MIVNFRFSKDQLDRFAESLSRERSPRQAAIDAGRKPDVAPAMMARLQNLLGWQAK